MILRNKFQPRVNKYIVALKINQMEKPKQEDFETDVIYIVALEEYIKFIEKNTSIIKLTKANKFLKKHHPNFNSDI